MAKKKPNDTIKPPTNPANLSQNQDKKRNMPIGAETGAGQGAGRGSK